MKKSLTPLPRMRMLQWLEALSGKEGDAMEGYWLTHYETGTAHGDGIMMMHGGELLGGDLEHMWSGTYEEELPKVYARIRIVPFVSREEEATMAREWPIIMNLSGFCTEEYATLDGHPDEREDMRFHVEMKRCKAMREKTKTQAQTQKAA